MKLMLKPVFISCILNFIYACNSPQLTKNEVTEILANPNLFHNSLEQLTDIIVHDIFSPPVASRIYVYPCIAAYETLSQKNDNYKSLAGQLNGLMPSPVLKDSANISYEFAAIIAFMKVGENLVFSEDKMDSYRKNMLHKIDSLGVPSAIVNKSMAYGEKVAQHILQWASKDNYKESRSFAKYSITADVDKWKPTPPAYMEGIEPHWRTIRTLIVDAANQFTPAAPPQFSMDKASDFYKLVNEVYQTVNNLDEEQTDIAKFWDCNPYAINQTGHMMYAVKKITPGGHWMGISSIASKKTNSNLMKSVDHAVWVSVALFDAFISCWDEKYRSNLIRPETLINEYIDETWMPVLQTPPFPEHTSGHSVISAASAVVLSHLLGDGFSFSDDVEVKYGLPVRHFTSFLQAAEEAAISRLYGGIHYKPAIDDGITQGKQVGEYIIENLSTKIK